MEANPSENETMRAKRILAHARREGWLCVMWVSGAVASGVWAAVAMMHQSAPGGAILVAVAIVALRLATWHGSERSRLRRLVLPEELRWNPPPVVRRAREERPVDPVLWLGVAVCVGLPALLCGLAEVAKNLIG